MSNPLSQCQNCGWDGVPEKGLDEIPDLLQRIAPGEIVPSGVCPECFAVCHLYGGGNPSTNADSNEQAMRRLVELYPVMKYITRCAKTAGPHGTTMFFIAEDKMEQATEITARVKACLIGAGLLDPNAR